MRVAHAPPPIFTLSGGEQLADAPSAPLFVVTGVGRMTGRLAFLSGGRAADNSSWAEGGSHEPQCREPSLSLPWLLIQLGTVRDMSAAHVTG